MFTPEDALEKWLQDYEEGATPAPNMDALKMAWELYTDPDTDGETKERLQTAIGFMIDSL